MVNHFALAPDMGGGTRHVELGRELARRGWRVTIAASDFHVLERTYARRANEHDRRVIDETVDGVRLRWLWSSPYSGNDRKRIANWLTFARSVTRVRWSEDRPDVVLGSSPQLFAALSAWRVARGLGVPFVFEVRDLWPESLGVGARRRGPGYWGLWLVSRFLYRVASNLIIDRWRRKTRDEQTPLTPGPPAVVAPEPDDDVARTFAALAARDRALLWLAYVEEESHEEIAASLGVGKRSVKVLLFRAKKRLRELLHARGLSRT